MDMKSQLTGTPHECKQTQILNSTAEYYQHQFWGGSLPTHNTCLHDPSRNELL